MKRVKGYVVYGALDERTSGHLRGPYKDNRIAEMEKIGAAWYGSDGFVKEIDYWENDHGDLYEIPNAVRFVDVERKYKEEQISKIKNKLSEDEWSFLIKYYKLG